MGAQVLRQEIWRTFRELATPEKNNDYAAGEVVVSKLHDGFGHSHGRFDGEFRIRVSKVYISRIGQLDGKVFAFSDARSQADLMERFSSYYGKKYTPDSLVRVIEFDYV